MSEEQGRRFATGPGGEIMVKYPLQYCKAVFLGGRPRKSGTTKVFNGTATLLELPSGIYAVTCAHVIDAYYDVRNELGDALLQIGMTEISVEDQLVCKNDTTDLVTIRLTTAQLDALQREGEIGSRVIRPAKWPPEPVEVGQPIMFGGFPGAWREWVAHDELVFGSFSTAGIKVTTSHSDRLSCQLERDYWISSVARGDSDKAITLKELGGLSGGPAFVDRGLQFEFAGIIYQHAESFDILFLRPAGLINPDGSIKDSG